MRQVKRGFALTETLVALLLLAISLLGSAAALMHAISATRAALWQARAADLAADLTEALRSVPPHEREALVPPWQRSAGDILPLFPTGDIPAAGLVEAGDAGTLPATHAVQLAWRDPAEPAAARLELPFALSAAEP